jgi:epoxyqueuosine reductase
MWGMPIPREARKNAGNYIFRCGFCQEACPKNKDLTPRKEVPFTVDPVSNNPELIPLLLGNDEYYEQTLPRFALRAGIDTLRRNVTIAIGNCRDAAAIPALARILSSASDNVRAAAAWALGNIGGADALLALKLAVKSERDTHVREEIEYAVRVITTMSCGNLN